MNWVVIMCGVVGGALLVAAPARAEGDTSVPAQSDDEWEIPHDAPVVLHATALDRELDGDIAGALVLLREAINLTPSDPMIAFDLARIAFDGSSERFNEDVAPFLALAPSDEDARLLRAYILMRQGERAAALEELHRVLEMAPSNSEALLLNDAVMSPGGGATQPRWIAAGLQVGMEVDTNVTVVPDSPSRELGVRLGLDGFVSVVPLRNPTELTLSAAVKYAPHINDRDFLETYDVSSALLTARARQNIGPLLMTAQLSGSEVLIDSFREQFMQDVVGDLEAIYPMDSLRLGIFARVAYRDFVAQNPEANGNDRDGGRYSAGGRFDWDGGGSVALGAQASFEGATADGAWQREAGMQAGGYLRWRLSPVQLHAWLSYALRGFPESTSDSSDEARLDHRLSASLTASLALNQNLGLFASVLAIGNFSNHPVSYERLVTRAGVSTQW